MQLFWLRFPEIGRSVFESSNSKDSRGPSILERGNAGKTRTDQQQTTLIINKHKMICKNNDANDEMMNVLKIDVNCGKRMGALEATGSPTNIP